MNELSPLLAVWAHPDDECFLSSGLMVSILEAGGRVVVIHATRGEAGSQDHERWPPERMAELRERELADALAVLGVTEHHWLGYIDGECHRVSDEEAIGKIAALIEQVRPRTVLTFDEMGGTGHADHIAVNRWTRAAFDRAAAPGASLMYAATTPEWADRWCPIFEAYNVFAPGTPVTTARADLELSFRLDERLLDLKMKALHAQASQTEAIFAMFGEDGLRASHAEENFVRAAQV